MSAGSPSPSRGEGKAESGAPSGEALRAGASVGWTQGRVRVAFGGMILAGLVLPFLVYPVFVMNVLCMALFASAFNLLLGYTGLLSFGHAAFLGAAGYVCGHALKAWGLPTPLGILLGVAFATLLGAIIGGLAIRRSGIYFAMITLGLAQVIFFVMAGVLLVRPAGLFGRTR